MEQVKIYYRENPEDFKYAFRDMRFRIPKFMICRIIWYSIVPIIFIFYVLEVQRDIHLSIPEIILDPLSLRLEIFLFFMIILSILVEYFNMRKYNKAMWEFFLNKKIKFKSIAFEEGIMHLDGTVNDTVGISEWKYDFFEQVKVTKNYILFRQKEEVFIICPKCYFTQGQWETVTKWVGQFCKGTESNQWYRKFNYDDPIKGSDESENMNRVVWDEEGQFIEKIMINYRTNPNDYKSLFRDLRVRIPRFLLIPMISYGIIPLWVMCYLVFMHINTDLSILEIMKLSETFVFGIVVFLGLIFTIVTEHLRIRKFNRMMWEFYFNGNIKIKSITFESDVMHVDGKLNDIDGISDWKYCVFDRIRVTKKYILFRQKEDLYIACPKNYFTNEQWETVKSWVGCFCGKC